MEYAVIRVGGKQYKVAPGAIIEVDRSTVEPNGQVVIDDVLMFVSDGKIKIGNPRIADVKIKAKVLEHKKGEKIRVAKFKAKVRYRRVMGFRPLLTRLQIESIELSSVSKTVPKRQEHRIVK